MRGNVLSPDNTGLKRLPAAPCLVLSPSSMQEKNMASQSKSRAKRLVKFAMCNNARRNPRPAAWIAVSLAGCWPMRAVGWLYRTVNAGPRFAMLFISECCHLSAHLLTGSGKHFKYEDADDFFFKLRTIIIIITLYLNCTPRQ